MLPLPRRYYDPTLAALDLEAATDHIEAALRIARMASLATELRDLVTSLANEVWRMEPNPSRRRAGRIHRARDHATRIAVLLDACKLRIPSQKGWIDQARELLAYLVEKLDEIDFSVN